MKRHASVGFVTLGLALGVLGAIGPVTDLPIVNKDIAPDGFTRAAVLAGGTFPGPLITGQKVHLDASLLYNPFFHDIDWILVGGRVQDQRRQPVDRR